MHKVGQQTRGVAVEHIAGAPFVGIDDLDDHGAVNCLVSLKRRMRSGARAQLDFAVMNAAIVGEEYLLATRCPGSRRAAAGNPTDRLSSSE